METKVRLAQIILALLLSVFTACNCSNNNFPTSKNDDDLLFKKFDCKSLSDLKLTFNQNRRLKSETRKLFGTNELLQGFCYTYRVNANNFGLVEAFNFSSHQTKFLFLFSKRRIAVLQSEREHISLKASFEERIKLFKKEFDLETIDRIKKSIEDY